MVENLNQEQLHPDDTSAFLGVEMRAIMTWKYKTKAHAHQNQ